MSIRTIFFGTPNFAAPILSMLCSHPALTVVSVVAQPDKPVGRKQILTAPPTKIIAEQHHIPVYQPTSLRTEEAYNTIKALAPDLIIVAAYGKIIPENILNLPQFQCLNVHPSDLPKYRGASPLQYTIWHNEKETKTTIMVMEPTLDTGPIVAQSEPYVLSPQESYLSLEELMAQKSAELLSNVVEPWCKKQLHPLKQNDQFASYTKILSKEDGQINWQQPAAAIDCQIRALNPWPSTFTFLDGKRIKITQASLSLLSHHSPAGTMEYYNQELHINCGQNTVLQIHTLQLEGKTSMTAREFIAGYPQYAHHVLA